MNEIYTEIKKFLKDKIFITCLIFTALLSFGYGITHVSIGIDDLCFDRYVKGTWILSANRWGTWALYNFFRIDDFTPFWLELITVFIYFITALVLCSAIKSIAKDKVDSRAYILLACGYISFPILSYQFVYQSTNFSVALSNLILIIIAYLIFANVGDKKNKLWFIPYVLISAFAIACYESCVQTYAVFAIMLTFFWVKYSKETIPFKSLAIIGGFFILSIVIAIGVYYGIAMLEKAYLKQIGELHFNAAYNTTIIEGIKMGKEDFLRFFLNYRYQELFQNNSKNIFVFTIAISSVIFMICTIAQAIKNRRYHIIWLSFLAVIANLIFPVIFVALLYRIYYSWTVMIGIEYFVIFETVSNSKLLRKYKIGTVIFIFLAFVIFMQSKETSNKIYDDWRANEEAKNKFMFIGNTIESECSNPNKPVIYKFEYLENGMTDTFEWTVSAFGEIGELITKYINYYGFSVINSGKSWKPTEDYDKRKVVNSYVSEGEKYIYVEINQD